MGKETKEEKFIGLRFTPEEYDDLLSICPRGQTVGVYLKGVILQLVALKQKGGIARILNKKGGS